MNCKYRWWVLPGGEGPVPGAAARDPSRLPCSAELLEENDQLIRCIVEYQSKGRATDCVQYQDILHRNLIYLATIADATPPSTQKAAD
ncbi:PREDICTED: SS18-like protein 2 [Chaetura pelagica]|uniref:SS18-like protein 2 n=1 Tax=Chaetura pelagica TaxID=8897 RepID=UPI0005231007|nr:PREDICTED: SS18-like protein 2 [Chaetura pelagica]